MKESAQSESLQIPQRVAREETMKRDSLDFFPSSWSDPLVSWEAKCNSGMINWWPTKQHCQPSIEHFNLKVLD